MGFEFFRKEKDKIFLGLDIGTETIKALIFKTDIIANEKRKVILGAGMAYFKKFDLFYKEDFQTEVLKKAILQSVETACQSLTLSSKKTKKKEVDFKKMPVVLGLSPDILKARIVWQRFKRETSKEKISKTEKIFICQQVFRKVQEKISQKLAKESGILPSEIQWISLKIQEITIDGYPVEGIQKYEGKELAFKILAVFSLKYCLENIKRILENLQLKIFKIVHPAENLLVLLKNKKTDAAFFDVGGEVSQFFLVKNGKLQQVGDFPGGGREFTESLCDILGLDEETARILKEKYSDKILTKKTEERIKEIFLIAKRNWQDRLGLLSKKMDSLFFSSPIFLFGGGSLLPEIKEIFQESQNVGSTNLLFFKTSPAILIYPKEFKNIEDLTKGIRSPQYISSLLLITK